MPTEQQTTQPKLAPTNEILSAFLSNLVGSNTEELKSDTQSYIRKTFNLDLSQHEVKIVENDSQVMHLILPYYSIVEEIRAYYQKAKAQARQEILTEAGLAPKVATSDNKNSNAAATSENNVTLTIGDTAEACEKQRNHH